MKIKTLNNYVILDVIKTKPTHTGKIILSNKAIKNKTAGSIKYINKNKYKLKTNDIVYFDKYSAIKIKINGTKQICVKLNKLICKNDN